MKHKFRIIILGGENQTRLLSRILLLFNRRNLKMTQINVSNSNYHESIIDNNAAASRYVIDLKCHEGQLIKVTKSIEKLIGIIHVYFFKKKEKNTREHSWKKIDFPIATS
ncbi:acetolactate synthase [Blattabacterium cuenoti]|uniref:acetolactate synthase n=1 Tax=Blattabacterium cuenoti TaxID=1653831 RepID=UPI00163CDA07|nr:acetolactate synthase [Blattabacterium cuenoti]